MVLEKINTSYVCMRWSKWLFLANVIEYYSKIISKSFKISYIRIYVFITDVMYVYA